MKCKNTSGFLLNDYEKRVEFRSDCCYETGFSNLDEITHVRPGLYVIGAISSLGKTTFAYQMGNQMAEFGHHVLYFTLEQSQMDLVVKGLSRMTVQNDSSSAISTDKIIKYSASEAVLKAKETYLSFAERETICECNFETSVKEITDTISEYIIEQKVKPVVFVDYLQLLNSNNSKLATRESVDSNIRALKKYQVENNLVLFVISSLNRQNYLMPIDFESFKESGGIEYTADVLWGLQLKVMNDDIFNRSDSTKKKRELVKAAKLEIPRKIELVCLKDRYGTCSYSCNFDYYPQYSLFVPEYEDVDLPD